MYRVSKIHQHKSTNTQLGFTLIELMVALLIGVVVLGGVFAVLQSNQVSFRAKIQLEEAQEAFRFSSHTISRLIKLASDIDDSSDDDVLVINFEGGPGIRDCIGQPVVSGSVTNTFSAPNGSLLCNNGSGNRELARRVSSISFTYGVDTDGDGVIMDDDFVAAASVADWDDVVSVRTTIVMLSEGVGSEISLNFTSTIRSKAFAMAQ